MTIYFLGEGLECVDVPVLKINRHYLDVATGDEVRITDPFVEALTHDAIVVQINRLKDRRRTELEQLLEVFDQGRASRSDPHLLDILEENFPERYREVLRRLMRAGAEQEVRDRMDVEDDVLTTLQDHVRESADLRRPSWRRTRPSRRRTGPSRRRNGPWRKRPGPWNGRTASSRICNGAWAGGDRPPRGGQSG